MPDRAPVPATLLTGFLGAGKTTLLSRLLAEPQGLRFGVLVNDFGAINIDADLIAAIGADQVALSNGCVCCSIRDDLLGAVARLLDAPDAPDRLVIEASGVSRPLPILEALEDEPRLRVDGVFCLIDAAGFEGLDFADTELAMDQALGADIALLNKADLVDAATLARIDRTLRDVAPRLRTTATRHGDVPRALLFDADRPAPAPAPAAAHHHHHDHHHDHADDYAAWSWSAEGPLDEAAFRAVMAGLPDDLLRAKGVFDVAGRRTVFQLVGKRRERTAGGEAPAVSRFVALTRRERLDPAGLDALFAPLSRRR